MTDVYFIGIGGIGMSAIARYFKFKGLRVSGYDRTPSPLTDRLQAEGIEVHFKDDVSCIPEDASETLVIYTPAVPDTLEELKYVRENGYRVVKRSKALGEITAGQTCRCCRNTRQNHYQHANSAYSDRGSKRMFGISRWNLEELRHQPADEPHTYRRCGSGRV